MSDCANVKTESSATLPPVIEQKGSVDSVDIKEDGIHVDGKLILAISNSDPRPNIIFIQSVNTITTHTTAHSTGTVVHGVAFNTGVVHNVFSGAIAAIGRNAKGIISSSTTNGLPPISIHIQNSVKGNINTGSGSVSVSGDSLGGVTTQSGSVKIDGSVLNGPVKTMSGSIKVGGSIMGDARTMSGTVQCEGNIDGNISTISGSVRASEKKRALNEDSPVQRKKQKTDESGDSYTIIGPNLPKDTTSNLNFVYGNDSNAVVQGNVTYQ